jgi:putative transposase
MDLFSRQIVGWSMGARMETELVLNALLMGRIGKTEKIGR